MEKTLELCYNCDEEIQGEILNFNDDCYCEYCFEKLFSICEECNATVENDETVVVDGNTICNDCKEKLTVECSSCEKLCFIDDVTTCNDNPYCEDCTSEYLFTCNYCGDLEHRDNRYYTEDDGDVCEDCRENHYCYCENCGDLYHEDRLYGGYCSGCDSSNEIIKDASFKPKPIFYGEKSGVFMGIENEVDVDNDYAEDFDNDFSYCKYDGSLDEGFEIVTHPFTLKYEQENKRLYKMCLRLQKLNCRIHYSYGLHIHVNRGSFKDNSVYKLLYFFDKYKDFIFEISGRNQAEFNSWAKIYSYNKDEYNSCYSRNDRYCAINNTPNNTVEFRFFRGIKHYNILLGCLEFIQGLVKFADAVEFDSMTKDIFIEYLEKNGYKNAIYLINKRLASCESLDEEENND